MREGYYFPHFADARNDRKIKRIRKELGIEGYAIFFMVLEVLRNQTDFSYPIEDLDLLADDFGTSEQKVMAVIFNYQLFDKTDDEFFLSPKLLEYMQPYLEMKKQRSKAGKASALARAQRKQLELNSTLVEHPLNECSAIVEQEIDECSTKEKKVKEKKEEEKKIEEVKNYFNEKSNKMSKIMKLTAQREKHLKARIKEHDIDGIMLAIDKATSSDFLNGENQTGWKASFDWIMNPNNIVKILEGNFDNKATETTERYVRKSY